MKKRKNLVNELEEILKNQRDAIEHQLKLKAPQLMLDLETFTISEKKQADADKKHMEQRLISIEEEIRNEPSELKALYDVSLPRLQPVGLVVLWPKTRG